MRYETVPSGALNGDGAEREWRLQLWGVFAQQISITRFEDAPQAYLSRA